MYECGCCCMPFQLVGTHTHTLYDYLYRFQQELMAPSDSLTLRLPFGQIFVLVLGFCQGQPTHSDEKPSSTKRTAPTCLEILIGDFLLSIFGWFLGVPFSASLFSQRKHNTIFIWLAIITQSLVR